MKYFSSCHPFDLSLFGETARRAIKPIANLMKRISTGVNTVRRIFVETNVSPQISKVREAAIYHLFIFLPQMLISAVTGLSSVFITA